MTKTNQTLSQRVQALADQIGVGKRFETLVADIAALEEANKIVKDQYIHALQTMAKQRAQPLPPISDFILLKAELSIEDAQKVAALHGRAITAERALEDLKTQLLPQGDVASDILTGAREALAYTQTRINCPQGHKYMAPEALCPHCAISAMGNTEGVGEDEAVSLMAKAFLEGIQKKENIISDNARIEGLHIDRILLGCYRALLKGGAHE